MPSNSKTETLDDITARFAALSASLANLRDAGEVLPQAGPWLTSLGMLAIDLNALGCQVTIEVIVHRDAVRVIPLPPPPPPQNVGISAALKAGGPGSHRPVTR